MADVRNHPAINYYKSGVPIVFGGDDPGSFGYNDLTVDYYLAFMSWGLSLYDFREIANNSIRYSTLSDSAKLVGFSKFNALYSDFINKTFSQVCSNQYQSKINVTNVYPNYGPNDKSIDITIYGYGYETTFCKEIACYFDNVKTTGFLGSFREIVCQTPLGFTDGHVSNVSIGYGTNVVSTDLKYKFVSSASIHVIDDSSSTTILSTSTTVSTTASKTSIVSATTSFLTGSTAITVTSDNSAKKSSFSFYTHVFNLFWVLYLINV